MRTFRTIVITCVALANIGCDIEWTEERYDNVVRVLMHEPHRYTLHVQEPGSPRVQPHEFEISRSGTSKHPRYGTITCGIHLLTDAETGAPMWATLDRWGGSDCRLTIHLHDPAEIEGGGWTQRRGFGKYKRTVRGTTQVIE